MSNAGMESSSGVPRGKFPALGEYGLVGDCSSAALISSTGRVDWLCWPEFDRPSIFGALLDPGAGTWAITPTRPFSRGQSYVGGTNVLETRQRTESGSVRILDFMPMASEAERSQMLSPDHELLRIVEGIEGEVELSVVCQLRPRFGMRAPRLRAAGRLGIRIEGRQMALLRSTTPLDIRSAGIQGTFRIRAGERVCFSLVFDEEAPAVFPPLESWCLDCLRRTTAWWRSWLRQCHYRGPFEREVHRSALVLKLLAYSPSGAMVAAPTTSLPERLGGSLNWDYRYCWLRDASMTARALFGLGFESEADGFVGWLLNTTSLTAPRLDVVYDVFGRDLPKEETLDHLRGYRESRPVRISNAAKSQLQLDIYGEVVDAAMALIEKGGSIDRAEEKALVGLGRFVCSNWRLPDEGIWEPRGIRQEHTHSRLMCWVALDRLMSLQKLGHVEQSTRELFARERVRIRAEILTRAWNPQIQSYVGRLDGDASDLDATLLLMSHHGFALPGSRRMQLTHQRIQQELGAGKGLVYRYKNINAEGAFGICSFWEAEFLALGGGTCGRPSNGSSSCSPTLPPWAFMERRLTRPRARCWATIPRRSPMLDSSTRLWPSRTAGPRALQPGGRSGRSIPMNMLDLAIWGATATVILTILMAGGQGYPARPG